MINGSSFIITPTGLGQLRRNNQYPGTKDLHIHSSISVIASPQKMESNGCRRST